MVTGDAAEEAVRYARAHPDLATGLHLVVVSGTPALPPAQIPHLVDSRGRLPNAPVRAGLRYQFRSAARAELRREIREQLVRFARTGLTLSHVDGHLHMHMHPVVLGILVELAEEFSIPAIRLPKEELRLALACDRSAILRKITWFGIFGILRRHGERVLRRGGIRFADRVYGLLLTGRLSEERLIRVIEQISVDTAEIYCHPALELPGEPRNGPRGSGHRELSALIAPRVRRAVERSGFTLGSYRGGERPARASGAASSSRASVGAAAP